MTSLPTSIKFNVGGRHFEVSRDLIEQQPDSMLGTTVSGHWHPDREKTIFIDRNGDIFAQVIEYLRYGCVVLPTSVPKEMFVRDLDYYGLGYEEGAIKDGDEVMAELREENARMKEKNAELKENMTALENYAVKHCKLIITQVIKLGKLVRREEEGNENA
ncbi:hypothetical protein ACHAWF_013354 [Thalassiosira exigua]